MNERLRSVQQRAFFDLLREGSRTPSIFAEKQAYSAYITSLQSSLLRVHFIEL
ncbi:hypothetical protein J22TS3_36420 [Paenibacillus sp. J22TS3]|nr:hypothetical protein J22TS3_36420 [Paenibacillus sp. J22TS3]